MLYFGTKEVQMLHESKQFGHDGVQLLLYTVIIKMLRMTDEKHNSKNFVDEKSKMVNDAMGVLCVLKTLKYLYIEISNL